MGRAGRLLVVIVGMALTAGGGYGLARSFGAFGNAAAGRPLLASGSGGSSGSGGPGSGFWVLVLVVALLVAYLGFLWLRSQLVAARPVVIDHGSGSGGPGRARGPAGGGGARPA